MMHLSTRAWKRLPLQTGLGAVYSVHYSCGNSSAELFVATLLVGFFIRR